MTPSQAEKAKATYRLLPVVHTCGSCNSRINLTAYCKLMKAPIDTDSGTCSQWEQS